jgi:DNA-binding GntR family transcriptional regulator
MVNAAIAPKRPVRSARLTTYEQLKQLILSGQLRPAERLSEARLAERLGVSRTPLREALMKLDEEGLVVGQRNVGYSVADLDIGAVRDLLVVREALDTCAAALACKEATERDFERIRDIVAQMKSLRKAKKARPVDIARDLELGIQIHVVIAEATRNFALIRTTAQIYQQLRLALWLEVLWLELPDNGLAEHMAIASAILSRDAVAAKRAARAHVRSTLENMERVHELYKFRTFSQVRGATG